MVQIYVVHFNDIFTSFYARKNILQMFLVYRQFNDQYRSSFIINVHFRRYTIQGWITL